MFDNNLVGLAALVITAVTSFLFFRFWLNKIWLNNTPATFLKKTFEPQNFLRISLIIISIALLFYMDFIRDYVFKNLTYRMNYVELIEKGGSSDKYLDPTDSLMVAIFGNFTSYQLYYSKIVSTLIFLFVYFLLCQIILKLTYIQHRTLKFTSLLYGTGYLFMMLVFSFYFFTFPQDIKTNFYLISMELGHFLESSLPTLLLLLSFKIYLRYQNINQIE